MGCRCTPDPRSNARGRRTGPAGNRASHLGSVEHSCVEMRRMHCICHVLKSCNCVLATFTVCSQSYNEVKSAFTSARTTIPLSASVCLHSCSCSAMLDSFSSLTRRPRMNVRPFLKRKAASSGGRVCRLHTSSSLVYFS